MRRVALLILIFVFAMPASTQQELLAVKPGESLQQFGLRVIPKGRKLMHPVVKGEFTSNSTNIIVLFNGKEDRGFTGWVLVPERDEYKRVPLPEREFPVSTKIRAVFFAKAGQDRAQELFILCEHISGAGRYPGNITPFYTTYVYGSDGNSVTEREDIEDQLDPVGQLRTARQVLRRLKELRD